LIIPFRPCVIKNPLGGFKVLAAPLNGPNTDLLLQTEMITTTINYSYDPLNRLTAADYDDGTFFHYTYDAVGNRLTQTTDSGTNTYAYDTANRLTSVDGVTYTWDNNGNLLSDGTFTYTYDSANRLVSMDGPVTEATYAYYGLGDRLGQTVSGVTTDYTIDIAGSLSKVLADGTKSYLYGNWRIAQQDTSGAQYFLGDVLGSVR
jgi:YD repeat-containing protein